MIPTAASREVARPLGPALRDGLLMAAASGLFLSLAEIVAVLSQPGAAYPTGTGVSMLATWLAVPYMALLFFVAMPGALAARALSVQSGAFTAVFAGTASGLSVLIWLRTISRLGADANTQPVMALLVAMISVAAGAGAALFVARRASSELRASIYGWSVGLLSGLAVLVVTSRSRRGLFGGSDKPIAFWIRLTAALACGLLAAFAARWVGRALARSSSARWMARAAAAACVAWVAWSAWGFNSTVLSRQPVVNGTKHREPSMTAQEQPRSRPNVLLISIDTLRADHLSCYGHPGATSPHIDALARDGILFRQTASTASFTLPAHASMMSGLFPSTHGATYQNRDPASFTVRGMSPGFPTLAELLSEAGYDSAGFASGPLMSHQFGFGRGFDLYDDRFDRLQSARARLLARTVLFRWMSAAGLFTPRDMDAQRIAKEVTSRASAWLSGRRISGRPFFLFTHYWDPHGPYEPPDPYDRDATGRKLHVDYDLDQLLIGNYTLTPSALRDTLALYDGEIQYMDQNVGELLDFIRKAGWMDDTIVILTSDHGESFGEHNHWEHSRVLYEDVLHVPFIMRLPRGQMAGRHEKDIVAQPTDILPTVLAVTGIETPREVEGRNLLALLEGREPASALRSGGLAFAELDRNVDWPRRWGARFDRSLTAVRAGNWKYIRSSEGDEELYDLVADPGELQNLAAKESDTVTTMRRLMESWRASLSARQEEGATDIDEGLKENLRSLGYIQ